MGDRLNPIAFAPFPALYVGDSHETCFSEKFATRQDEVYEGLTSDEIVLRKPASLTYVRLNGTIELCFDAGNKNALRDFTKAIARFKMPEKALRIARSMGRVPPQVIRTVGALQEQLLHLNWNTLPIHFSLPSNSQIFGRLVAAAGFHGIQYPSARQDGGKCLALFPQNWRGSGSWLEVADLVPEGTRLTRLDGASEVFE